MRIVLTGGGTGGHIYPALSLWRYLSAQDPSAEAMYIGGTRGLEKDIVLREGLPFEAVEAAGLRRQLSLTAVRTARLTLKGYWQARGLLKRYRPDVVLGTGGYVTLPVVFAARALRIPAVIWEGNAVPGLTNRLCAKRANAVALSFLGSEANFTAAKRTVFTGNPRASEVLAVSQEGQAQARSAYGIDPRRRLIVFFAGSRGAETVNDVLVELMPRFADKPSWQLLYVTGEAHYEKIAARLGRVPENVILTPFVHDMPSVLPQAAVAVTRAGSGTLAEICALGVASILIPSPYVTANHQEANARRLADQGAAYLLKEADLSADSLWRALEIVLETGRATVMREAAKRLATPDSVERLYHLVIETAGRG